jgi:Arc/MetJ family transcription regulator
MRTNIEIDDRLMRQAMQRGAARTSKAAVEAGWRLPTETHV